MQTECTLIYVHDPMCSWCWGFRPALQQLRDNLPDRVGFGRLLGGLARDSDAPMPGEMREHLQQTWRNIQTRIPGTAFNFGFWTTCAPRRSTWPACRAVIAARTQRAAAEEDMILAIQRAYYLEARNPSDDAVLLQLGAEIGLDVARLEADLNSPATRSVLDAEIAAARAMAATSFPSLRLRTGAACRPIQVEYTDPDAMLRQIRRWLGDVTAGDR